MDFIPFENVRLIKDPAHGCMKANPKKTRAVSALEANRAEDFQERRAALHTLSVEMGCEWPGQSLSDGFEIQRAAFHWISVDREMVP
jgi:hypothetical protein